MNKRETEIWKPVSGYSFYDVSDLGRVRSWRNNRWGRSKEAHVLKPTLHSKGYLTVKLCKSGQSKTFGVHSLVLTVFVGPRPTDMECCHRDGSKTNNDLSNLRWDTHSANIRDAIKHGAFGINGPRLTEANIIRIRKLYDSGITQAELGNRFNVDQTTIGRIGRRQSWASLPEQ